MKIFLTHRKMTRFKTKSCERARNSADSKRSESKQMITLATVRQQNRGRQAVLGDMAVALGAIRQGLSRRDSATPADSVRLQTMTQSY